MSHAAIKEPIGKIPPKRQERAGEGRQGKVEKEEENLHTCFRSFIQKKERTLISVITYYFKNASFYTFKLICSEEQMTDKVNS